VDANIPTGTIFGVYEEAESMENCVVGIHVAPCFALLVVGGRVLLCLAVGNTRRATGVRRVAAWPRAAAALGSLGESREQLGGACSDGRRGADRACG